MSCDLRVKSATLSGGPYRLTSAVSNRSSRCVNWPPAAWKSHTLSSGHLRSRFGIMRCMLSMGGTAAPGLVSVLYAHAPPWVLSCSQYDGGTQSYGPVIFTPLAPEYCAGLALADEIVGFGQASCRSMSRYIRSTLSGGGLSLPLSQTSALGCARNRRIWSRSDAAATRYCSGPHFGHSSHALQQTQPVITRIPRLSARFQK